MDPEVQRARIRKICLAFPEANEVASHPDHSGFQVKGKNFAYFLNNHHGDGVVAITCKALPGVAATLVDMDRTRFYLPAYMARHGWVAMRLDLGSEDWRQVEQLLREAYVAMAPKRLAREFAANAL